MKAIIDKDKYKQVKERLPASLKVTHHSYDMLLMRNHEATSDMLDEKLHIVIQFARHCIPLQKHHFITSTCPLGFITIDINQSIIDSPLEWPPRPNHIKSTTEEHPDPFAKLDKENDMTKRMQEWSSEDKFKKLPHHKWMNTFLQINAVIAEILLADHGVKVSFSNGTSIILHFGDALMLLYCREKDIPFPKVLLSSMVLNDDLLNNSFTDNFWEKLTDKQKSFLFGNIDGFWMAYTYWSNHSYIPTRLSVPDIPELSNSHYLSERDIFKRYMDAKMDDFRRSLRLYTRGVEERYAIYGVKYETDTNLLLDWYVEG